MIVEGIVLAVCTVAQPEVVMMHGEGGGRDSRQLRPAIHSSPGAMAGRPR